MQADHSEAAPPQAGEWEMVDGWESPKVPQAWRRPEANICV